MCDMFQMCDVSHSLYAPVCVTRPIHIIHPLVRVTWRIHWHNTPSRDSFTWPWLIHTTHSRDSFTWLIHPYVWHVIPSATRGGMHLYIYIHIYIYDVRLSLWFFSTTIIIHTTHHFRDSFTRLIHVAHPLVRVTYYSCCDPGKHVCVSCALASRYMLSCTSLSAKEPLISGLFCGKKSIKIRDSMRLCHPVWYIHVRWLFDTCIQCWR